MHNYPEDVVEFTFFKTTNVSQGEQSVAAPSHLSCPLLEISEKQIR